MALYRQVSWKLRWHTTDGQDWSSERPRRDNRGAYLDLPPNPPTLVEFGPEDRVDVADLLRVGAIAPYEAPSREEVMDDGENRG